eukprot:TRINITY_DN4152_c1_g1_i1.p2 TRINITY_DN4152_c1_g1~~TRINITY_DN4152_c1_g1_i1.p2  ORF type:complete len:113 (-),score=57.99 TRINITY_DN4152_c1_g1_i1:170-508(-)
MSRQHDVIVEEANPPPSEEHLALRLPETEPALVARVQAIVAAGEGDLARGDDRLHAGHQRGLRLGQPQRKVLLRGGRVRFLDNHVVLPRHFLAGLFLLKKKICPRKEKKKKE